MEKEKIFYDVMYGPLGYPTNDAFFVEELRNESNICRYMDLPELIYFIEEHILEFKQLALFGDPNENRIFLSDEMFENYYQSHEDSIEISYEDFLENAKSIQAINSLKIYGLCFTLNCDEKYMWDHYADKQVMVRIKNTESLSESFNIENRPNPTIFIEKAKYIDLKNREEVMEQLDDYFKNPYLAPFIKDSAYQKENEIRAICRVDTIYEGVKNLSPVIAAHLPPVLQINTNPDQLIEDIILSPYLPESKQKAIKSVIKSLSTDLTVCPSSVEPTPHLYKKILREIDFSDAQDPDIKALGKHKEITINNDGTFEIRQRDEEESGS